MLGFNLVQCLVTVVFPQNAPLFYLFLACIYSKWKLLSGVLRIKVSPPDPYYPLYQWLLSHPPSFSTLAHIHHIWIYPATCPSPPHFPLFHTNPFAARFSRFFLPGSLPPTFLGCSSQFLSPGFPTSFSRTIPTWQFCSGCSGVPV